MKDSHLQNQSKARFFSSRLLFIVLLLALAACTAEPVLQETSTPGPTPTSRRRDESLTLKLLLWQPPGNLNPHLTSSAKDRVASRIVYEPLASFGPDGDLVPFLADGDPTVAEDGSSVTWNLKKGVKWSDGTPFTADDVIFTYTFISDPETQATSTGSYTAVESVEKIDDHTVLVNFTDVNPAWALPFVGDNGLILPKHIFEDYVGAAAATAPANLNPIGTGPYQMEEYTDEEILFLGTELVQTNRIIFTRNPNFRDAPPFFERIEVRGGGTVEEAARLVLQVGEVDYAWNLQADTDFLEGLSADGVGRIEANFGPRVERLLINQTDPNQETADGERSSIDYPHPFFSDKRVRQALSLAIDREAIAALYGPTGRATSNILVSPANFNSPATNYTYDPEQARQLLETAGWQDTDGNGFREKDGVRMSVVFQTSTNPLRQETQRIIKENLEAVGIEVELRIISPGTFTNTDIDNPNNIPHFYADLQEFSAGNRNPDPGPYMRWWICDQIPQMSNDWRGRNVERWCNPEYDALYQSSLTELNQAIREQLFISMNDLIINEVVLIPLVNRAEVFGVNNTVEGLAPTPWDADTWNIKDWRRSSS